MVITVMWILSLKRVVSVKKSVSVKKPSTYQDTRQTLLQAYKKKISNLVAGRLVKLTKK